MLTYLKSKNKFGGQKYPPNLFLQSKQQNIMNKTIAQQLNIKDFPFEIKDKNDNRIYFEASYGYWVKYEYDQNGNEIYFENSTGYWRKYEYDQNGKIIYVENSNGYIEDNRPKVVELTLDEIAEKLNIDVNLLKIKK